MPRLIPSFLALENSSAIAPLTTAAEMLVPDATCVLVDFAPCAQKNAGMIVITPGAGHGHDRIT